MSSGSLRCWGHIGAQETGQVRQAECPPTAWQEQHARISSTKKSLLFNHSNKAIRSSLFNFSSVQNCASWCYDWVSIPPLAPGLIVSWGSGCYVGGTSWEDGQAECSHTDWQEQDLQWLLETEKMSFFLPYLETTVLLSRTLLSPSFFTFMSCTENRTSMTSNRQCTYPDLSCFIRYYPMAYPCVQDFWGFLSLD